MSRLSAHGITVDVPAGWDGRISVRRDGQPEALTSANGRVALDAVPRPVLHVASFGLPEARGDFGGGVVELMGDGDVFVVLFEYEPAATGTALFARQGMPRVLDPARFHPQMLRKGIRGQSGYQTFFQTAGRAFTLYAVIGSHRRRATLVPRVNALLAGIGIGPPDAGANAPARLH